MALQWLNSIQNLYGKSTTTDILLKSDLQARMLRNRLTPCLHDFVASSLEEIRYATEKELPVNQGTDTLFLWAPNYLELLIGTIWK